MVGRASGIGATPRLSRAQMTRRPGRGQPPRHRVLSF